MRNTKIMCAGGAVFAAALLFGALCILDTFIKAGSLAASVRHADGSEVVGVEGAGEGEVDGQPMASNDPTELQLVIESVPVTFPNSDCFGACGAGCAGCRVTTECRAVGFGLIGFLFEVYDCYTRPCCLEHDRCLSDSWLGYLALDCHVDAAQDGCGLADASGNTRNFSDARPFEFDDFVGSCDIP